MSEPLYVRVVAERCCGYGLCAAASPEVYHLDDGGFAYVDSESVDPGQEPGAREGAAACPAEAILVSEHPF